MSKKLTICLSIGFIIVELILYCCILSGVLVVPCEFASVVVAFLFSLIFLSFKHNKYLTQLGLLFTVVADVFLVLIEPRNQAIAMTSFSLTQIFYFIKILQQSNSKVQNRVNIILRIIFIVVVVFPTPPFLFATATIFIFFSVNYLIAKQHHYHIFHFYKYLS